MLLSTNFCMFEDRNWMYNNSANYYGEGGNLRTIRLIRDAGITAIDFNFNPYANKDKTAINSIFLKDRWKNWIKEMRRIADNEGMVFTQSHMILVLFFNPDDQFHITALAKELESRIFESCNILGVNRIVYHPYTPQQMLADGNMPAIREFNVEWISESAKKAAAFGLNIAVENADYCGYDPYNLAKLVDTINLPNVDVCLDTGHANITCKSPNSSFMNVEEAVHILGSRIKSLHVADNMGLIDQHLPPFYGNINWRGFIQALADISYNGNLNFECDTRNLPFELQSYAIQGFVLSGLWLIRLFNEKKDKS